MFSTINSIFSTNVLEGNRSKYYSRLRVVAILSFVLMTTAQIILIITSSGRCVSDALSYSISAKACVENGWFYPSAEQIQSRNWVAALSVINLLALVYRVFGTIKAFYVLNVFFTNLLLWSCASILYKITERKTVSLWFVIIFCFLNVFWSETVQIKTEIIFTSLAFFSIWMIYTETKLRYLYSGILLTLANWTRPLAIAFALGIILHMVLTNRKLKEYIAFTSGILAMILIIGGITYLSCGRFIFQPVSKGANLLMSANDNADGSYIELGCDENDAWYIPQEKRATMDVIDIDNFLTKVSVDWILKNPLKYIKQFPAKLFYLFATDTYSACGFFDNAKTTGGIAYIKEVASKLTGTLDEKLQIGDVLACANQLLYMVDFALFIVGVILALKRKQWKKILPFLLIFLAVTGITVVVVCSARYHFPLLPIMLAFAAHTLDSFFTRNRKDVPDREMV